MTVTSSIADRMDELHGAIDASLAKTAHQLDDGHLPEANAALAELAAGLRRHIALEETQLFPAFARSPAADLELLAAMNAQHREIEALIATMITATATHDRGAALHAKAALHAALGVHDDEEEALCAALDRALDADARAALIAHLAG
ncbi:MAG: hemerythrin domain-containing protein [Myxococcales bacterium]|nr:hemerythrin domain-containing protein [Myxococcales bacterium]